MPKFDRPLKITSETIDQENPEGLDNALRILAELAVRKYLRKQQQHEPVAPMASAPIQAGVPDNLEGRKLLDIDGLSKYLSMPKATIYTWVSLRKIPAQAIVRLGRALRFDRVEIDRWVESSRASR